MAIKLSFVMKSDGESCDGSRIGSNCSMLLFAVRIDIVHGSAPRYLRTKKGNIVSLTAVRVRSTYGVHNDEANGCRTNFQKAVRA
jgi:hypothetical protein